MDGAPGRFLRSGCGKPYATEWLRIVSTRGDVAGGEGFFGFGANAEVGVGFGVEDLAVSGDDVCGGQGKTPAFIAIDEGQVDEDG